MRWTYNISSNTMLFLNIFRLQMYIILNENLYLLSNVCPFNWNHISITKLYLDEYLFNILTFKCLIKIIHKFHMSYSNLAFFVKNVCKNPVCKIALGLVHTMEVVSGLSYIIKRTRQPWLCCVCSMLWMVNCWWHVELSNSLWKSRMAKNTTRIEGTWSQH